MFRKYIWEQFDNSSGTFQPCFMTKARPTKEIVRWIKRVTEEQVRGVERVITGIEPNNVRGGGIICSCRKRAKKRIDSFASLPQQQQKHSNSTPRGFIDSFIG